MCNIFKVFFLLCLPGCFLYVKVIPEKTQKNVFSLKMTLEEFNLILSALEEYVESETIARMNNEDAARVEKLGRYMTFTNFYDRVLLGWGVQEKTWGRCNPLLR